MSDGYHIGLLIMAAIHYLAPQFLEEGRLLWLRSPLHIIKTKNKEYYYYTDEEFEKAHSSVKGEATRAKGLGALTPKMAAQSMFSPEYQRLEVMEMNEEAEKLLEELMGEDIEPRREFLFNKIDFSEVKE